MVFTHGVVVIKFRWVSQSAVSPTLPHEAWAVDYALLDRQLDDVAVVGADTLPGDIRVGQHVGKQHLVVAIAAATIRFRSGWRHPRLYCYRAVA